MGQAKQRGTFEQRKTQSITQNDKDMRAKRARQAAQEAARTPQDKAKRGRGITALAMIHALCVRW